MQMADALNVLGVDRVIWVDDVFNKSSPDLAEMLINASEVAVECDFKDIADILAKKPFGDDGLVQELSDRLAELGEERKKEIRDIFFAKEAVQQFFATQELQDPDVNRVCGLLRIKENDRWNFEKAAKEIPTLCEQGDASVAYLVDLNESGKSREQGLRILEALHASKSKGTAFILTHEADRKGEIGKEAELRRRLGETRNDSLEIPICVIAKERLFAPKSESDVEKDLMIAVKRAGIRRGLSVVVARAKSAVAESFDGAADKLLSVPPEHLEEYVFEQGYREGVSELHVVERILTSQIAQELRIIFGMDGAVLDSARRLRELKSIKLAPLDIEAESTLAQFRLAEVWESSDLINASLASIACGDVFETDDHEQVPGNKKKFVLLAQPCDIALRPENKSRARETGFLVPLSKVSDPSKARNKDFVLPCKLDESYWECQFGNASSVQLSILDLVSFRTDGRLRLDVGHEPLKNLIPSQSRVYEKRTASASKVLIEGAYLGADGRTNDPSLQLTFTSVDDFKQYYCATLGAAAKADVRKKIPELPKRVTWRLRRVGRIRMPYAVALLDHYLAGMSRHAFDRDYMSMEQKAEVSKKTEVLTSPSDAPVIVATDEHDGGV